jgi:hypothetical protein
MDLSLPKLNPPIWAEQGPLPPYVNVVCVKWGSKYSAKYVDRLRNSVARWMPDGVAWGMFCITDDEVPDGVVRILPMHEWGTWWQKMNLFDPEIMPHGPTLYLDLDVVLTGSLEPLLRSIAYEPLVMVENFSPNKAHCAHNSSVMLFDVTEPAIIGMFREFVRSDNRAMEKLHGDQCAIWRLLRDSIANFERRYVVSYKYHCRGKGLPHDARVVVFHGKPDPHEVPDAWVRHYWGN